MGIIEIDFGFFKKHQILLLRDAVPAVLAAAASRRLYANDASSRQIIGNLYSVHFARNIVAYLLVVLIMYFGRNGEYNRYIARIIPEQR